MPGADRDGLTAGPADRLQAVGGAIVALDSGLGHMSEAPARYVIVKPAPPASGSVVEYLLVKVGGF